MIKKKELINAIEYFSFKYPNYKFITEESVLKICNNYGLVYGPVNLYTGTVPDKNLKHIEEFQVAIEDQCYIKTIESAYGFDSRIRKNYLSKNSVESQQKQNSDLRKYAYQDIIHFNKALLEIAAPKKDFNMEGYEVKNFKISKIEIPDPIVLYPVVFNNQKHYLIVTAWGLEANDELIVNQKLN